MRLRRAMLTVVLAAVPVVVAASPAHAVTCNLLVDNAGDGRWAVASAVSSDQLDILSGDVASGPATVVAVLRMKSLADNVYSQLGVQWTFAWDIDGAPYAARLRRGAGPNAVYSAGFTTPAGDVPVAVSIDVATGVITWTIPRTAMPVLDTPGKVFDAFRATTSLLSSTADNAFSPMSSYVDQSPSCVPAA